jgi:hypothetical protein
LLEMTKVSLLTYKYICCKSHQSTRFFAVTRITLILRYGCQRYWFQIYPYTSFW